MFFLKCDGRIPRERGSSGSRGRETLAFFESPSSAVQFFNKQRFSFEYGALCGQHSRELVHARGVFLENRALGHREGSNILFFNIERLESAQERPKSAPRAPRAFQERSKRPQERPRAAQERPKSGPRAAQERPRAAKSGQEQPKSGQERPKSDPRAAMRGP